ncbi:MAG: hypothetical protein IJ659_04640 [Alloprevotella sp.]|nr:hypothetical protein [Alloprevotella sp.]
MEKSANKAKKMIAFMIAFICAWCTMVAQRYEESSIVRAIAKSQNKPDMSIMNSLSEG